MGVLTWLRGKRATADSDAVVELVASLAVMAGGLEGLIRRTEQAVENETNPRGKAVLRRLMERDIQAKQDEISRELSAASLSHLEVASECLSLGSLPLDRAVQARVAAYIEEEIRRRT